MATKIKVPLTKEEKRDHMLRRILLFCLLGSLCVLFVELIDRAYTVEYHRAFDILYIVFAVVMLIEAVFRIFRHSAKEGFLDYLKFDKAEFLWLVTCPVVLACASLIPEMAGWRWLVALKMPNVFGRYNDEKVFEIIVEIAAVILILIFVLPFFNLVAVAISRPGQTVNLLPKDIDFWGGEICDYGQGFPGFLQEFHFYYSSGDGGIRGSGRPGGLSAVQAPHALKADDDDVFHDCHVF